jgi:uncharacterized protein YyaL (SSP411 family)
VDWFPWGQEAFDLAREQDKPIFLSIGYSACHWCHVMAHESFEDEDIATQMNRDFINIKVDREERPDVDSIYMAATQAMTGRGGWPMSVFMTPDKKPFYTGTYYPPMPRQGMPSFRQILESLSEAYRDRKSDVLDASSRVLANLAAHNNAGQSASRASRDIVFTEIDSVLERFDYENGGIGGAPKFPQPLIYEYLLRAWYDSGNEQILEVVTKTLTSMARGGMYDQVGGGFHRYSVDEVWLVPHFEKMLYDNALLVPLYLHAYQVTKDPFFREVAEETLEYVRREMLDESGGFYTAQDADSEGLEGKFFVWEPLEFAEVLGAEIGTVAAAYWSVSETGNFEGKNILWAPNDDDDVATDQGMSVAELKEKVQQAKKLLFERRESRIKPGLDDKIITSWNALMQKGFAVAGAILERPDYVDIARRNAEFLRSELRDGDRILRTWKSDSNGGSAKLNGYLDDYAFQVESLLSLYEASLEPEWLSESASIADKMIELFWDENSDAFFDTGSDHEELLVRPRDLFDNATPSGGSVASLSLLKLAIYLDSDRYREIGEKSLASASDLMKQAPLGVPNWLSAVDFNTTRTTEIVIVGDAADPATRELWEEVHDRYSPNTLLAGAAQRQDSPSTPLLAKRDLVGGMPTAYVCENYVCQLPVTDRAELAKLLDARRPTA